MLRLISSIIAFCMLSGCQPSNSAKRGTAGAAPSNSQWMPEQERESVEASARLLGPHPEKRTKPVSRDEALSIALVTCTVRSTRRASSLRCVVEGSRRRVGG